MLLIISITIKIGEEKKTKNMMICIYICREKIEVVIMVVNFLGVYEYMFYGSLHISTRQ